MTEFDTKLRIIDEAKRLFALKGFEGTSVRDIAMIAGVNPAAINYHFQSKENLYLEIMKTCYNESAFRIKSLEKKDQTVEELVLLIFRSFQTHSTDLVATFKMLMSYQHQGKFMGEGSEDEMLGPPGGKILAQKISEHLERDIETKDLLWAVRTLYSHIIHISLMRNCCSQQMQQLPFNSEQDIEEGIKRLTRIVLKDLQ